MPSALDQLKRMSFDNLAFPIIGGEIKGAQRYALHEFPHAQGAAIEKMGRRAYEISVEALFDEKLLGEDPEDLPLWPDRLALLMRLWEGGSSRDLHVPTIGTIKAFCANWTVQMKMTIRSGQPAQLLFVEDQSDRFLVLGIVNVLARTVPSLVKPVNNFLKAAEPRALNLPTTPANVGALKLSASDTSLLSKVVSLGDEVGTLVANGEIYTSLVAAKSQALLQYCQQADSQIRALQSPEQWHVVEALHQLGVAANDVYKDAAQRGGAIRIYVVPPGRSLTIGEVATNVYGEASKTQDIIRLNTIEDFWRIQPGTRLRVYIEDDAA